MKKFLILVLLIYAISISFGTKAHAQERFFPVESIDTMKLSRDAAGDKGMLPKIPELVGKVAALHPTHISIATPYDEKFYPVLKSWVDEARINNLHVWFRGNFSGWEGWFDFPKFTDYNQHHTMTYAFITSHQELFKNGDIFTPVPEAENGGPGDPRGSAEKSAAFNQFLIDSYDNCVNAFAKIGKKVTCGYFSTNGDIARQVLTKETVKKIGNRVVIDHYVNDIPQFIADIQSLHEKFDTPVVLGEYGAPIPDIHGNMTPEEQKDYIKELLIQLAKNHSVVEGVNYWTAFGGSTQIFDDAFNPKPASEVLSQYYLPLRISGHVEDIFGFPVRGVNVATDFYKTTSDWRGNFSLITTADAPRIIFTKNNFTTVAYNLSTPTNHEDIQIALDYTKKDFMYYLKKILHALHV